MSNTNINRKIILSGNLDVNYTNDYELPTWSFNSFDFDNTNNIFTGDSTISTTLNNAIVGVNKQFTLSIWVRRKTPLATTQILFCRDKSSATSSRQVLVFFNSSNKLVVTLYTDSTNNIQFTSTDSFADARTWNNIAIVYDGTIATVTNRISVYLNGFSLSGSTTQTGTFTTINNITTPNVNVGGRSDAANYSSTKINQVALFNTNLSAANVKLLYNTREPFDIRTNTTLNANLVMFLSADTSSVFTTNWAWTDLVGGGVFTSSGMVVGDLVADAPALKKIKIGMETGQSNDVGRVNLSELETKYTGILSWLQFWNGTSFVDSNTATNNNQYGDLSGQYGVEFYLYDKINKFRKLTQRVFKYALGGSSMTPLTTPSWCIPTPGIQPSGGILWQAVYNTQLPNLQDWELNNGYTIVEINWNNCQGEKDSGNLTWANDFETNQTNWYLSFRGRMESLFYITPHFYDRLLSVNQTNASYLYKSIINTAKTNIQAAYPDDITTINTDTCTVQADLAHFDKKGFKTLAILDYNSKIANGL